MTGYDNAQMVLGDDFHGIEVGEDSDVGVCLDGFYQAGLYLGTCVVLVVQDTEFRVTAFLVEIEFTVLEEGFFAGVSVQSGGRISGAFVTSIDSTDRKSVV